MPWTASGPNDPSFLAGLLKTQARVERLRLAAKLAAAELHLKAAGVDAGSITAIRQALLAKPVFPEESMFAEALRPQKPATAGAQKLQHLKVTDG